jgi:hypothetical protein
MFNEIHETNKEKYATILRSLFSNPEMLNYDGSINQEFDFKILNTKDISCLPRTFSTKKH